MVHITCDMCGKDLTGPDRPRFVVKIAAYAGYDPDRIAADDLDDEDHMEAVAELLRRAEFEGRDADDATRFHGFRFDLCPDCHRRFLKDPLNREALRALDFSKN